MNVDAISAYVKDVQKEFNTDKATEHSYRPALKQLLEAGDVRLNAVNEGKTKDRNKPDFVLLRDKNPVALVEAKDVHISLDDEEDSEQMTRYHNMMPNVLLTNYLEFRWYVKGEIRETATLAEVKNKKIKVIEGGLEQVEALLRRFRSESTPYVDTPEDLAVRMAEMAREIAYLINDTLKGSNPDDEAHCTSALCAQWKMFRITLVPNLARAEFADMYAQTLTYGLFTARYTYTGKSEDFSLENAFNFVPKSNPFLFKLFEQIARGNRDELDKRVFWLVELLAQVLAFIPFDSVLKDFGKLQGHADPIFHFYETFLARYNPKLREVRGVYYTPEPVVDYIVRSVDLALQKHFNKVDGLADRGTLILDPATGTGTFLSSTVRHIKNTYYRQQDSMWQGYVSENLLPRLFGFELLVASYAVAHMKLGIQLGMTDYKGNDRLKIYLTNTLEDQELQPTLGFAEFISKEANEAVGIKKNKPIMVVMGNPPYSGHSANRSRDIKGKFTWIGKLLRDYYQVDGKPLGERNPKWLQDDYVKFIRFGQWRIGQTGSGILAFVTNHGYLNNPTFRGMRQQLMQEFTDIYILNLHGNSKKKEKTPDGGIDQNVFDIQQGVAIGIFVKSSASSLSTANIHYADVWGRRDDKYKALRENDLNSIAWETFNPQEPYYLFTPQDLDLKGEYNEGKNIQEIFGTGNPKSDPGKFYSLGIITHNDPLHIGWTSNELTERVSNLADSSISDAEILRTMPVKESNYWQTLRERQKVRNSDWKSKIIPIYYRPFDWRYIYYEPSLMDIGRGGSSRNVMLKSQNCSMALMVSKGYEISEYEHVLVSDTIAVHHAATRKEGNYFFPLYHDVDQQKMVGFDSEWSVSEDGRVPNLNVKFVREMAMKLGLQFLANGKGDISMRDGVLTPEDIFHYAYAVLYSPTYRERYAEFLKTDFPKLPITSDVALFRALCVMGKTLVDTHLLKNIGVLDFKTVYRNTGESTVANKHPKYENGSIYVNKTTYFENVPEEVWDFYIGGYQVLKEWLTDRIGRPLHNEDVYHYQMMIVALQRTIQTMEEIDDAIGEFPIR